MGGRGASEVLKRRWGGGEVLAILKRGHNTFCGSSWNTGT